MQEQAELVGLGRMAGGAVGDEMVLPRLDVVLGLAAGAVEPLIPGGRYVGNPNDIPTIGTRAVLVSSGDQPDEVVYALVKAVADNFAVFRQLHPALSTLAIQEMVPNGPVMPLHPGALKYYREAGLTHQ